MADTATTRQPLKAAPTVVRLLALQRPVVTAARLAVVHLQAEPPRAARRLAALRNFASLV